ncbi:class I SAM-dependent methyltransferase [Paracoccus aurantiacus]|uniref:class I SAM-dependent methyltransferase n=1 Tax=Paracoccus aurantiacus TaxID=2599412 RepID=UPI00363F1A3F
MTVTDSNFSLTDEIKTYWSQRAAIFDSQVGHEIFSDDERAAWHALLLRHLGKGEGQRALDLGCGTGVITQLMAEIGYQVTGMDWSEPMLAKARAKAAERGVAARFLLGDAERTMEPDNSYDVIITRHLVWTLVDPPAAFAEWRRLLRSGGRLLMVDGDFVTPTWIARIRKMLGLEPRMQAGDPEMARTHREILARVWFSGGARAQEVAELISAAGFSTVQIDANLSAIHRAQGRDLPFARRLDRGAQHRYAILAS